MAHDELVRLQQATSRDKYPTILLEKIFDAIPLLYQKLEAVEQKLDALLAEPRGEGK